MGKLLLTGVDGNLGSEAPFSSDVMVTFAQAIREGKMDVFTDDF